MSTYTDLIIKFNGTEKELEDIVHVGNCTSYIQNIGKALFQFEHNDANPADDESLRDRLLELHAHTDCDGMWENLTTLELKSYHQTPTIRNKRNE